MPYRFVEYRLIQKTPLLQLAKILYEALVERMLQVGRKAMKVPVITSVLHLRQTFPERFEQPALFQKAPHFGIFVANAEDFLKRFDRRVRIVDAIVKASFIAQENTTSTSEHFEIERGVLERGSWRRQEVDLIACEKIAPIQRAPDSRLGQKNILFFARIENNTA